MAGVGMLIGLEVGGGWLGGLGSGLEPESWRLEKKKAALLKDAEREGLETWQTELRRIKRRCVPQW